MEELRPADAEYAVSLPAALRWLLRRVAWVREAFTTLSTLLPALHGTAPTVAAMRARLARRGRRCNLGPEPSGVVEMTDLSEHLRERR